MKQLPRNVRVRRANPPPTNAESTDTFEMAFTPPPPSTRPRAHRASQAQTKVGFPASSRLRFLAGIALSMVLTAALLAGVKSPPSHVMAVQKWVTGLEGSALGMIAPATADAPSWIRQQRADAVVRRAGYSPIPGGVLFTPETFSSSDGSYDLLLHFHGNVKVVLESAVRTKLNAVVAVINLGVGSQRYQDTYGAHGSYEELLNTINKTVERRGLARPHLRRVALSSWSAGYGAISTILLTRRGTEPLDAILMVDGLHSGWLPQRSRALNPLQLAPFVHAAHAAASDAILFTSTYSEIDPITYAGSRETSGYLLESVNSHGPLERGVGKVPEYLQLESMKGAISRETRLRPFEEARIGDFRLRGFRGNTPEDHMSHLFQMGATVLPELLERWTTRTQAGRVDAMNRKAITAAAGP